MPDAAGAAAASHDPVLFYFVCALSGAIAIGFAWVGKYVVLPIRDGHLEYLKKTGDILPTIASSLQDINDVQKEIRTGQKTLAETWRCKFHESARAPHGSTG